MSNYIQFKNEVNLAARAYYLLKEPIFSDEQYDIKYRLLLEIEKNQGYADDDSPTQKVGYSGLNNEKPHKYGKMLSLDNVTSKEELSSFFKSNTSDMVAMPKLDGLAMSLYYDNGIFVRALLRGDGVEGADVSALAVQMSGVPLFVDYRHGSRITGEIITFSDHWKKDYKNHRNYVSGSMNKVDTDSFKDRALSFVAFDTSLPSDTFVGKLNTLNSIHGLIVIPFEQKSELTAEELRIKFRDFFPYCDGIVYAQNDLSILKGETNHHPYNKVAYKFPEEQKLTKLLGVEWEMGRTKTLTPVGIMEPVILDGATVTRASLSNLANINRRGIAINDIVIVHKAKEIIPQILATSVKADNRIPITITKCPNCLNKVEVSTTGVVSCVNHLCGGSDSKTLTHFCKSVGIKGIGAAIADGLVSKLTIQEILQCDDADLCNNSRIAEKNAQKVVDSIAASFNQPRWKAWVGMGIPLCGNALCERLPVTSLLDLSYEKLIALPKVADTTAVKILDWIDSNILFIKEIEALYTKEHVIKEVPKDAKKVYITGKLPMSRAKVAEYLLTKGMVVMTTLSRNTDLFIAGDGAKQHKIDKARELGVEIVYGLEL